MHMISKGFIVLCGLVLIACSPSVEFSEDGPKATHKDFEAIAGDWQGTLTYADYSSGKRTVIASNASVSPVNSNRINYTVSYPNEPWEDTKSSLTISKQGRLLEGHVISERNVNDKGVLIFVTLYQGEDDNRTATIRQTYGLSATHFFIRKEVQFDGEEAFLFRNIYEFTRAID